LSAGLVGLEATRAVIGDMSRLGGDSSINNRLGVVNSGLGMVNSRLRNGSGDDGEVQSRFRSRLGSGLGDNSGVSGGLGGRLRGGFVTGREGFFSLGGISSADVALSGGDVVPEVGLDGAVGDLFTDGLAIDLDGGIRGQ